MKARLLRILLVLAAISLPLLLIAAVFMNLGAWLLVADPLPPRLDAVFTFAGENPRITYSRELAQLYPEARWVLSDHDHLYRRILARNGFDLQRVDFIDTCTHTLSEVRSLADWVRTWRAATGLPDTAARLRKSRTLRIGLVSAPYHQRRIKTMVKDVFGADSTRFYYLPVPLDRYGWRRADFKHWWRSKAVRPLVASEIGKVLIYWFLR